jgi:hypothetical protein
LHFPWLWRVLLQRQMRAGLVIIGKIRGQSKALGRARKDFPSDSPDPFQFTACFSLVFSAYWQRYLELRCKNSRSARIRPRSERTFYIAPSASTQLRPHDAASHSRPASRAFQGARRADRFTLRAGIMQSPTLPIRQPHRRLALWLCIIARSALSAYCGELQYAEFEREILRERTRAGLAHARENGKRLGRPATAAIHAAEIRKLYRAGVSKSEIARRQNIGRTSVRRILRGSPLSNGHTMVRAGEHI